MPIRFACTRSRRSQAEDAGAAAVAGTAAVTDVVSVHEALANLRWLSDLDGRVYSTLDEMEVLTRLARAVAGRLGDAAIVDMMTPDERLVRVTGAVANGVDVEFNRLLLRADITRTVAASSPTVALVKTGVVRRLHGAQLDDPRLIGESSRALLNAIGATAVLVIPLIARSQILGVIGLMRCGGPAYTENDELLCADLSRRAALAVDNARLYREQREFAVQLQHTLLPTPVATPGIEVACRYFPAGERHDIGGDWYDAFPCPGNPHTTTLVIGDVAGHDLRAAATMATVRNLIRGLALAHPPDCASLVQAVDGGFASFGIHDTVSLVVLAATAVDEQHWQIAWTNAGHPPPLLVGPDGQCEVLSAVHGPLLGTGGHAERSISTRTVRAGSDLVLYTDGLVERRGEAITVGIERLAAGLRRARRATEPAELLARIIEANRPSAEDDTALLVARIGGDNVSPDRLSL